MLTNGDVARPTARPVDTPSHGLSTRRTLEVVVAYRRLPLYRVERYDRLICATSNESGAMANNPHQTPGVFVQEKDAFPPSIVGVDTAVPVFIGYTKKADQKGHSLRTQPVHINSMADYMAIFGGPFQHLFRLTEVTDDKGNPESEVMLGGKHYRLDLTKRFYLYNSMQLFYANGGGSCYVVSVGDYDDQITKAALIDSGLAAVKDLVGPTMLVIPEAVLLGDACAEVAQAMLKQCLSRTDRVALLDVWGADALSPTFETDELTSVITKFRNGVAGLGEALKYGAAYFPFLKTSVTNPTNTDEVSFTNLNSDSLSILLSSFAAAVGDSNAKLLSQTIKLKSGDKDYDENKKKISQVLSAKLPAVQDMYAVMAEKIGILPPSGAMAGVYSVNDSTRFVWNAPANIELREVTGPTVKSQRRHATGPQRADRRSCGERDPGFSGPWHSRVGRAHS